jgi:hypothetical protein
MALNSTRRSLAEDIKTVVSGPSIGVSSRVARRHVFRLDREAVLADGLHRLSDTQLAVTRRALNDDIKRLRELAATVGALQRLRHANRA